MADDKMPPNVDEMISKSAGIPTEAAKVKADTGPMYRMDPNSKIPVSKAEAGLWKSRRDAGKQAISTIVAQWKEAEAYYSLGQDSHRQDTGGIRSGNENSARNKGRKFNSTENIVYSNVNAIVPAILAKNPQAEITSFNEEMSAYATMAEHLINRLAAMKYAPGFNFKPKLGKNIMRTEITNEAWIMVGYTKKEDSAESARADLIRIGEELQKAETASEIQVLEGQLQALEELVDVLNPSGPFVRTFTGDKVLVDPTSGEDDFSDANWMMVEVMMPTRYLLAKYSKKNDAGEYVAVYNDKYVVNPGDTGEDNISEMTNFRLLKDTTSFQEAGFPSDDAFQRAKMSKVWYCFDKVKRRFLMIVDEKWDWPLWVYDDPYQLPQFFPLFRLHYHTDPVRNRTKGEVSYYLDQQDEINTINSEINWMRTQITTKVLYDGRYVDKEKFDAFMKGGDRQGYDVGKNMPEGGKMQDFIMAPPLPNMQYKELFSKDTIYQTIDRIGTANDVIRGAQFKTNTTNDAIGTYNSIQNQRLDEKIDAIEDHSGDVFYAIMFLCMQFMTTEEVRYILGEEAAQWQQQSPEDIRTMFLCTVVGGSTQKATSASKKDQALKISQIMGQFANAAPEVVIVMLKMMEQAFDDIVITAEDWAGIRESIQAKLQPNGPPVAGDGPSQPGQGEAEGAAEPDDSPAEDAAEPPGQNNPVADYATPPPPANHQEQVQLEMAIKKLPPQAQQAISNATKKGVPQQQAFIEVMKEMQKNPQGMAPPTTTH